MKTVSGKPSALPADLEGTIMGAWRAAKEQIESGLIIPASILVINDDGELNIIDARKMMASGATKDLAAARLDSCARAPGIKYALMVSEAWTACITEPAAIPNSIASHPDKQEAVLIVARLAAESFTVLAAVSRNPNRIDEPVLLDNIVSNRFGEGSIGGAAARDVVWPTP